MTRVKKKTNGVLECWSVRKLTFIMPLVVCGLLAPSVLTHSEPGDETAHPPSLTCLLKGRISLYFLALQLSGVIGMSFSTGSFFQNAGELTAAPTLQDQEYPAAHFP